MVGRQVRWLVPVLWPTRPFATTSPRFRLLTFDRHHQELDCRALKNLLNSYMQGSMIAAMTATRS